MRSVVGCGLLLFAFAVVGPVVVMFPQAAHAQAPDQEFTMAIGETMTFNARGLTRVTIGLPEVADAQTSSDGRLLIMTAKAPGVTTINIFSGEGQKTLLVRVVGVNPMSLAEEVREVLGERSGVDVRVVKGRVLLEGEVASELYKRKIDRLTQLYPNQVLNFANYREAFVEGARMVALDVYFIQIANTGRDNLGVKWGQFFGSNFTFGSGDVPLYYNTGELAPGVGVGQGGGTSLPRPAALTGGAGLNSYWSLVGNLNMALDFLVVNGLIKTVQHATIVTEAGTDATYHTGGTLLIPVATANTTGIAEKEFGLKVKVQPILDFENRVKLNIDMSYSELDFGAGVGNLPGIRNNDIKATVNMREGQSVLVTGQHNNKSTSNEQGLWVLGSIPILGWLFKNRSFSGEQMNNAMFVTPRVYEPGGDTHKALIQGVFQGLLDRGAQPDDLPELSNARK
ncbi:MAG: pilus assembly protein N-terminal domain-containing protein [Bradymonadaceae bacterium]|nr:pilus assembly protein N-terminal domain-containing protein [Lujinxingiaceae bacterium]